MYNTRKYATWIKVEFPDGCASNPISYDGHFILLAPFIYLNKQILMVYVYSDSSWHKVISNASMNYTISFPCITRLPTGSLMVMIDKEAFVMSIVGRFGIYNVLVYAKEYINKSV